MGRKKYTEWFAAVSNVTVTNEFVMDVWEVCSDGVVSIRWREANPCPRPELPPGAMLMYISCTIARGHVDVYNLQCCQRPC